MPSSNSRSAVLKLASILAAILLPCAADLTATVSEISVVDSRAEDAFRPRRLALLVGVNQYKDNRFRSLRYPDKDVADFRKFLLSHNHNHHDSYNVLLGDSATADTIVAALDEMDSRNTSEDDIILVYLSTHGTLAYGDGHRLQRYAVLADTRFDDVQKTGLSLDYIQTRLSRMKSRRKALILALCHSGSGKSQLSPDLEKELATMKSAFFAQPLHEVSSAMMVLSAASFGQPAREDEGLQNDIYTSFLLQGMAANDANQDGAVSLFEAHEYARSRTYDFTRGQQTPAALVNMSGTDPIILSGQVKRQPNPVIFADGEQFRNLTVMVNGETKGTLWNPQMIEPGRVRLTFVDPRTPSTPLIDHHVYVQKSRSYAASDLIRRQPQTGVEVGLYHLPLPRGIEGTRSSDLWSPQLAVRTTEILGSRFTSWVAVSNRIIQGARALDDVESSDVELQVTTLQALAGPGYYPAAFINIGLLAGGEAMRVNRSVANETYTATSQEQLIVYPVLTGEVRIPEIFGATYTGAAVSAYPARNIGLTYDGQREAVRPWSGRWFVGYSF